MGSKIFIPQKIKVGFQERSGTYTGKLAYVIYIDEKGVLRKQKSWDSWRHKNIEPIEFDNVPTDGFVLNKKVGGYSSGWNHRQTYTRIYDSRGEFEFEITVENLLYILENTNSFKGKGLEGKFVYGWSDKDLILIPCDSPDYKELQELNNKRFEAKSFKGKDLIIGATYINKNNEELVYMGRYDYHGSYSYKKAYFFYERNNDGGSFSEYSSISNLLIDCIDDKCCEDYADVFNDFEYYEHYNPYDSSKDEYYEYTVNEFKKRIDSYYKGEEGYWSKKWCIENNRSRDIYYYLKNEPKENSTDDRENYFRSTLHRYSYDKTYYSSYYAKEDVFKWEITTKIKEENPNTYSSWNRYNYRDKTEHYKCTVEEFVKEFKPCWRKEYLKDGKIRGGNKNE